MRRGSYYGGSTLVTRGRGWFSGENRSTGVKRTKKPTRNKDYQAKTESFSSDRAVLSAQERGLLLDAINSELMQIPLPTMTKLFARNPKLAAEVQAAGGILEWAHRHIRYAALVQKRKKRLAAKAGLTVPETNGVNESDANRTTTEDIQDRLLLVGRKVLRFEDEVASLKAEVRSLMIEVQQNAGHRVSPPAAP